MSTDAPQRRKYPRPSVVTLSCLFIGMFAFLMLTNLIETLLNWGTVDLQDTLKPMLRELHRGGAEVTMTGLLAVLRWVCLGMVVFTVSTLVFAVYAARGDRSARVFTTIFAVVTGVMSLSVGVFGLFPAAMLFVSAGSLWSPAASRWWRDEPEPTAVPSVEIPSAEALPSAPMVEPSLAELPPPSGPPPVAAPAPGRPSSVLTAGLVTIVGSLGAVGLAALYFAAYALYTYDRPTYMEALNASPFKNMIDASELEFAMRLVLWVAVALVPLALVGFVGAAALLARRRIGRSATLVWAWIAAGVGLLLFPIGLLALAGAGTVIVLLSRDDARAWSESHR